GADPVPRRADRDHPPRRRDPHAARGVALARRHARPPHDPPVDDRGRRGLGRPRHRRGVPRRGMRISPWLEGVDTTAALAFYEAAFGAECGERIVGDDGVVEVANLRLGDVDFWVQRDPAAPRGGPVRLILTVADPDATFARAVAAGATVVNPL